MIPSIASKPKGKQLYLFIVSVDKIFMKKMVQHLSGSIFDKIIEKSSGEGLFKELAFNPLPSKAQAIIMADFNLIDRDHPHVNNGLELLTELKEKYPQFEQILLVTPADKSVKNNALKLGVPNTIIKNDNVFVRFDILIKGIVSKLGLRKAKKELFMLCTAFGIFVVVAGLLIVGGTLLKI